MTLTAPTAPNFAGEVVNPGSSDYDSVRTLFNGLIDKRPSVLLRCLDPDNRFALNHNIEPAADS